MKLQASICRFVLVIAACTVWAGAIQVVLAQTYNLKTYEAGFEAAWDGNGIAVADYDGDGDLDVYFVAYQSYDPLNSRTWNRLYQNQGDGKFLDVSIQAGVRAPFPSSIPRLGFGNRFSASWGDIDNDGDPDLLLVGAGAEVLYRNDANGTFTDISAASGLNGPNSDTDESQNAGGLWWDYDLDGYLDLYISSWTGPNRFYHNLGNGQFEDIGEATGLGVMDRTWMATPMDFNDDGWPDLYLVNDFGPNTLYLNQGDGSFIDATVEYGIGDAGESMGLALGDANNDGHPELFITNNTGFDRYLNTFFLGSDTLPYAEIAPDLGLEDTDWAWGTEFFDADQDGDLDLFAVNGALLDNGTPNRFFRNELIPSGSLAFSDYSSESRTNGLAESRGLVVFDANDDGRLDLLVSNWSEPVYYYEYAGTIKTWLKVSLEGVTVNRDGLGSRVRIRTDKGDQYREYDGADFLGQSLQPVHFGLGGSVTVDELVVTWPGGVQESWFTIPANQTFRAIEGTGTITSTHTAQAAMPEDVAIDIYPVPARTELTISIQANQPSEWTLEIVDILGRSVRNELLTVQPGMRVGEVIIRTDDLPSGLFIIRTNESRTGRSESRVVPIIH